MSNFTKHQPAFQTAILVLTLAAAPPAAAVDRMRLSQECEIAVARSALPERLRADASVHALVGNRYEKVITGSGPFTCVVERNHPDSVIPQCMDAAGVDSVLPAIIDRSETAVGARILQPSRQPMRKSWMPACTTPPPDLALTT